MSTFEAVNKITPITDLRWSLAHVGTLDAATINRLKAMGAAIAVHPFQFLAGGRGGPPLRTIVDSGIKVGRRVGLRADLDAESVERHRLHGDRQELRTGR